MTDENNRSSEIGGNVEDGMITSGDHNVTLKDILVKGTRNVIKVVNNIYKTTPNWGISNRIVSSIALILLVIALIWLSYFAYVWYARKQILDHHLAVAYDFLKNGQYEKAKAEYRKASETDKENAKSAEGSEIVKALEELKDDKEQFANIKLTANRLLRQSPKNPFVHLLFGHLYAYEDAQKARQHYEKAISLDSTFAEAHFSLGVLLHKQGNGKEAIENFEKAVRISPLPSYLTNLAYSYSETGQPHKSIKIYDEILQNDKSYILVYCEIANVFRKMKNFEEAVAHSKQALDRLDDQKIANLPQNQDNWYFEHGKEQVYLSGISEKKYYVLQSLAVTMERLGESRKAREYLNQAQQLVIDEQKMWEIKELMKHENPN